MKKIKIIDLLNKIANGGKVPKKIKYEDDIYIHIDNYCYYCDKTNLILSDRIFAEYSKLNDEVEIIEEEIKKPEKPKQIKALKIEGENGTVEKVFERSQKGDNLYFLSLFVAYDLSRKINKLVEAVNYLLEKSDK